MADQLDTSMLRAGDGVPEGEGYTDDRRFRFTHGGDIIVSLTVMGGYFLVGQAMSCPAASHFSAHADAWARAAQFVQVNALTQGWPPR